MLAAAPDARVLVLQTGQGQRLWDRTTGKWTGPAKALPISDQLGFAPSGSGYVLNAPDSDRTQLRSTADDRLLYEFPDGEADLTASADDRLVAVCSHGRSPAVWDLAAHRAVHGAWEGDHGICDDENELLQFDAA